MSPISRYVSQLPNPFSENIKVMISKQVSHKPGIFFTDCEPGESCSSLGGYAYGDDGYISEYRVYCEDCFGRTYQDEPSSTYATSCKPCDCETCESSLLLVSFRKLTHCRAQNYRNCCTVTKSVKTVVMTQKSSVLDSFGLDSFESVTVITVSSLIAQQF